MWEKQLVQQLKDENSRLLKYIDFLEKGIQSREEKLLLMLDPAAFNQFKIAGRQRIGAVAVTDEDKKKANEAAEKRRKDIAELESMGIL